jgi:hypothetical protein
MMSLRFEAVLACDDVRQETNGKHILVGVYGSFIGLPNVPSNFRPTWWLQVFGEKGSHQFEFRIMGPNNAQLMNGGVQFVINRTGLAAIALPRTQLQLQAAGSLRLEWRENNESEWKVLKEIEVIVGRPRGAPNETNAPTASEQPDEQSRPAVPETQT